MSKVYGYCRTALVEGDNMEAQCALVENYCKSRDMNLEKCFCDAGVSAHNMDREGLDELFDVLEEGDVVVTKDISRFARDMVKLEVVVDKICNIGAEIMYVNEPENYDTSLIEDWLRSRLG